MEATMMFGDSRSSAIRHEIPPPLGDTVIYFESGHERIVVASALAAPALEALGRYRILSQEELGITELLADGTHLPEAMYEVALRACRQLGVESVAVPFDFPLGLARYLQRHGLTVTDDGGGIDFRRRRKSPAELDGIRRAQHAAELAMESIRTGLNDWEEGLTAEQLRMRAWHVFIDNGCLPNPKLTIACGPQGAALSASGEGPIIPGQPILVDVYPREIASGCWGDISRTFCVGEPPAKLMSWHTTVRSVQERVIAAIGPGVTGDELNKLGCGIFAENGFRTGRMNANGSVLTEGFPHILGHGLGLELHEAPFLDFGGEPLVVGDVVTVEPGLYEPGFGGMRIEDVVLVTDDGCERITRFPYELDPGSTPAPDA